jgi:adenine/guanine phosphoribosyltransferase-like PRPP-binding protein
MTYRFQWTPARFQEAFTYIVNLEARGFVLGTQMAGVPGNALRTISLEINGAPMSV